MTDILIRDLPDEVVAMIDASARKAGLSRNQYLRRALTQQHSETVCAVTVDDLKSFSDAFADLADDDIMRGAWS